MIKELLVPFIIGTVTVVMMFQANTYIYLGKNFNLQNVPISGIFQYIFYKTAGFMILTLPTGTALGTSLAMTRLVRESEVTAMRAAGTPVKRILLPLAMFGLATAILNLYIVEVITPPAESKANHIGSQIGIMGFAPDVKTNTMIQLGKYMASFGTVMRQGDDMSINKIMLIEQPSVDATMLITADKAKYHNGQWSLDNAYMRYMKGQDLISFKPVGDYVLNESIITADLFNVPSGQELTARELIKAIESAKKTGTNTKQMEVQLHEKFSVPAACFIFAFVAPLFALKWAKGGAFMGVLLSMGMVVLYYNSFVISTEIVSKVDAIPAWVAGWLPNIIFLVAGLISIRRLE
ncbi:LPS export ABC transporter permease LptF [soil metagenome]